MAGNRTSFKKGEGGRTKGAKNKRTEQWEAFADYCMTGGLERFKKELDSLKGEKYVNAFANLLEFHKPKLARVALEGNPDNPLEHHLTVEIKHSGVPLNSGE